MAERIVAINSNTYPGLNEAVPDIAYTEKYRWGSVRVTEAAMDAYGLSINPVVHDEPANDKSRQPELRYSADILIAGPQEVLNNDDPNALIFGSKMHRTGLRATLGANFDKDLAGIDLASRLINAMASELPEDEQPAFLMRRGVEIQDAIKDGVSVLYPHGFAHVTAKLVDSSFEKWATKQATHTAMNSINRATALALIGSGILYGSDWYPDGSIEGSTAAVSLMYVGYLAVRSRSEIRRALEMAPTVTTVSRRLAKSVSKEAQRDIHDLLCKHN